MADTPALPRSRPLRTIVSLVWERGGRWIIRPSLPHLVAIWLGVPVFGAGVLIYRNLGSLLPALLPLAAGGLAVLVGLRRRRSKIDWHRRTILVGEEVLPLDSLGALVIETGLSMWYANGQSGARQVWNLRLTTGNRASGPVIAQMGRDLALLRTARRLATALGVPVYDLCGPEGTVTAWHPVHGPVAPPGLAFRPPQPRRDPGCPEAAERRSRTADAGRHRAVLG